MTPLPHPAEAYWDRIADRYQAGTTISTTNFHYGPLLPGDDTLGLLPSTVAGLRCLEAGCGAGQNSIVLARQGAECVAVDVSEAQLRHGRALAADCGVVVDFRRADLDTLPVTELGRFDLVHSTYALPFVRAPDTCIRTLAGLLKPGGTLLLTTSHPVYAGEWVEWEAGGRGVVLTSYFEPPDDVRDGEDEASGGARSAAYPVSTVFGWLRDAGLTVDRMLEPRPLPVPEMTPEEFRERVPYTSASWCEIHPVLDTLPTVVVFRCRAGEPVGEGPGLRES